LARLLAASLMELVTDPTGDQLPHECWQATLAKADAVLFVTSHPETIEHQLAGNALTMVPAAKAVER
jgi:hypothetical protein